MPHKKNNHFNLGIEASGVAPDLAALAALLEIGDRLALIDRFAAGQPATVPELAAASGLPESGVSNYVEALECAGLIEREPSVPGSYRPAEDFARIQHQAGYVSWTMNANRPFIEHAREFLINPGESRHTFTRDGLQVAVSSQWMGSHAFYPAIFELIVERTPHRFVDLGCGSARLLIDVLRTCQTSTGLGLDCDSAACQAAVGAAHNAGVGDRLTIIQRSIQSIADDPSPLAGADVIHAGFVFHDMLPDEEQIASGVLANCRGALRPGGMMAITEAVPYLSNERERRFSAIVSYFHKQFMGRRLLTETEWTAQLRAAGFSEVVAMPLSFPTGRLLLATR